MFRRKCRTQLLASAPWLLLAALAPTLASAAPPARDDDEDEKRPVTEVVVTAQRLDTARANIEASLGASTYTLTNDALEVRPGGETTSLNQVLLQVPAVAQGGDGRLQVRQARGELQYRINNVILPEGLSDFGESLSPRLADKIELVTGALPAQYGLQVAGIVNITTKSGVYQDGGQAEVYGGSHGLVEPAFEFSGTTGGTNVFLSGSYRRNEVGLNAPDSSADPLHDRSDELEAFAFLDHVIDAQTRLSLMLGASDERFQIPNRRGLNAITVPTGAGAFQRPLTVNGVSSFPSEARDDRRRGSGQFAVLSYLRTSERASLQVSGFFRGSTLTVAPDGLGDLLFTGLSQRASSRELGAGLQVEGLYTLSDSHTLRGGVVVNSDRTTRDTRSSVLAIDAQGRQVLQAPLSLRVASRETETQASAFAQDEWRPLEPLTVNFGLRIDHVTAAGTLTQLSPRLSAVWTTPSGTTAHAGYARYLVAPPGDDSASVATALAGTTGTLASSAEAPLRAETDDDFDVGVAQKFEDLTLGVDGYWREARNLIEDVALGAPTSRAAYNLGRARLRGIEFSLTYADGPLAVWSNLAIAQAEGKGIVSNPFNFTAAQLAAVASRFVRLDNDQTYTASAGGSYRLGGLKLAADALYGSGMARTVAGGLPNGAHLPGYVQVNLAATYRVDGLRDRPLDLRLDVINAFDRSYEIRDGSALGAGLPQWGPRRGVFIGVEQAF